MATRGIGTELPASEVDVLEDLVAEPRQLLDLVRQRAKVALSLRKTQVDEQ